MLRHSQRPHPAERAFADAVRREGRSALPPRRPDIAVFQAFKEVEVAVRNTANAKGAGYADSEVGTPLMRKAFHPDTGPLADKALVAAEREAEMHLFAAAIGHAKNPTSHRDVAMTAPEAARLIVFASHLFDIVERRAK